MSNLRLEDNASSWGAAPASSSNIDWGSPAAPTQTPTSSNYGNAAASDASSNNRSSSNIEPYNSRSVQQSDRTPSVPPKQASSSGWGQDASSQQQPSCDSWKRPTASQESSGYGQGGLTADAAPRQQSFGTQRFGSPASSGGYEGGVREGYAPSPREGYVPSPRERLRMASGAAPDERFARSSYPAASARPSYPAANPPVAATPPMPPKPRPQMTDEDFFAKYGFHLDELPTATTKLSIPTATNTDHRSGSSFSGSSSFRASTSDSAAAARFDSAPSWGGAPADSSREPPSWGAAPKAAEQVSWGTTQRVEEPLPNAPATQKPDEPLRRSPSNERQSWNAAASPKTAEASSWSRPPPQAGPAQGSRPSPRMHEAEEGSLAQRARLPASSSARLDNDDLREVTGWSTVVDAPQPTSTLPAAEPEARSSAAASDAWCIDRTPSGRLVTCPQCRHEFTLP